MIAEIGHFALILALILALVQAIPPLALGGHAADGWLSLVRRAAIGQTCLIIVAFGALTTAFVTSDFSVANVAANSHTLKPLLYKISGVWGNHEGSMLLWVLILAIYGASVALFGANLPPRLRARVLAVQGLIGVGFLAFILFTSNPFERIIPAPLEGNGLNPLLQDPGLAFHPPFLYLGYVGFSMAFSFAVAALIEGRVDAAWARWVRPWTLAAWTALTIGIAMGSWWAYYELGWGGWWYWDPVENASFLPWLAGVALLHSATVVERRDALKSWTVLLAIFAFGLSLLGTFLVRSGVLTSVHSFASDPERGIFVLLLLIVAVGGALILYAIRAPRLRGGGLFAPISREGALVLNNLLFSTGTAIVLLGTLYPLLLDALGGGKVSVGPPFFEATFVPLMIPVLVACAIGPMLGWKRGDLGAAMGRLKFAALAMIIVFTLTLWRSESATIMTGLGLAIAAWLVVGAGADIAGRVGIGRLRAGESFRRARGLPRSAWGTMLAHGGIGILVAGVTASSAWQTESVLTMKPGDQTIVAGYEFTLAHVAPINGPNYSGMRGEFRVQRDGRRIAILTPEKRHYPAEGSSTTEAAIHTNWLADLYAVLGDKGTAGAWTVRLYHNPLVPWIWFGALITALGGLLSLTDRRLRVGAPKRAKPARPENITPHTA